MFKLEGRFCDLSGTQHGEEVDSSTEENHNNNKLAYCVTDVPPWYLCIILGIQVRQHEHFQVLVNNGYLSYTTLTLLL